MALFSTALTWGTLALALRSLESVWHDRVEALEFIHDVVLPLERSAPVVTRLNSVSGDSAVAVLRGARGQSIEAWQKYLVTYFTPEEAGLVRAATPAVERVHAVTDTMITMLGSAGASAADSARIRQYVDAAFLPSLERMSQAIEPLVELQAVVTRQHVEEARSRHAIARSLLIAGAVATLALVVTALRNAQARRRWTR